MKKILLSLFFNALKVYLHDFVLLQSTDFDPKEEVYKTRWMPPVQPVGGWGSTSI